LLRKVLTQTDWANVARFREILEEQRNDFQGALVPRGHSYAATRSAFSFSPAGRVSELTNGLSQMEFLVRLAQRDEAGLHAALGDLRSLTRRLLRSSGVEAVFTGAAEALPGLLGATLDLVRTLDAQPAAESYQLPLSTLTLVPPGKPRIRIIPATVGFVAHTLRASLSDDPLHAAELVLSHRLKTGYLWEEIRMKGGAYGAFSSPNGLEGVFTFATYRDPGLVSSLDTFRQSLVHARQNPLSAKDLKNTIIGTVSNDLSPRSPSEEAFLALQRRQLNISDALRQGKRDALLTTRQVDLERAAARLEAAFDAGSTYILTGQKIADEAMVAAPGRFEFEDA